MADQGQHEAGIQAEQPEIVEESNEGAHPAQPAAQPQVAAAVQQPVIQQISMASYQVPSPEKVNFKPEEWSRWIKRFERFRKATGLDQKNGEANFPFENGSCHFSERSLPFETVDAIYNGRLHTSLPRQLKKNKLRNDNGPQFDSAEFSYFAKEWGFKHSTFSPRFPQANGEVERGVRTMKNLLTKEKDPAKALLTYRSTPLACKFSPAQLLMGRQIRNSVPLVHTQLNPQWPDLDNLRTRESMSKLHTIQYNTYLIDHSP